MHLRRGKYPNIQLDDPDASQISFDASRTPIDLGVTNGKMVLGRETKLVAFWSISSFRYPHPRIGALLGAHEF